MGAVVVVVVIMLILLHESEHLRFPEAVAGEEPTRLWAAQGGPLSLAAMAELAVPQAPRARNLAAAAVPGTQELPGLVGRGDAT